MLKSNAGLYTPNSRPGGGGPGEEARGPPPPGLEFWVKGPTYLLFNVSCLAAMSAELCRH
jgi:hypothetical protein